MTQDAAPRLDIIIPVYNEGANIVATLRALADNVKTSNRILICYDNDDDDTLPAIRQNRDTFPNMVIDFVRNRGDGVHGAVMTGFADSTAPFVLVFPADDDFNAAALDSMSAKAQAGCDIVCASRFMAGGGMYGCPWLKAGLVRTANFTLYYLARLPTHDASNGFRMFSRHAIEQIEIESERGFCYSIEMLVKCHRLGWRIAEVPVRWFQRAHGQSRFQVMKWLPDYLRWYRYAFATTYLRRPGESVPRKRAAQ
ncbi:MAG: glycosyltransferase [Bryobacteraceae bacterium]